MICDCNCIFPNRYKRKPAKHDGRFSSENYYRWINMIHRCYVKSHKSFKYYGAIGVGVCERWLDSPFNFYDDIGTPENKKLSLDRIDSSRGYCPHNTRWANHSLQQKNKPFRGKKSLAKGVRLRNGRFSAEIKIEGVFIHIGTFSSEIDATNSRMEVEKEWFGFNLTQH